MATRSTNPTSTAEQRRHPRHEKTLGVKISRSGKVPGKKATSFEASVKSRDISVGGMFLASTFFLKKGIELDIEFELPGGRDPLKITGEVAHVVDERFAQSGKSTGFAIRFTKFHGDSEIFLRAFLAKGDLYNFVSAFAAKELSSLAPKERPKLIEMIVRWEMYQEALK